MLQIAKFSKKQSEKILQIAKISSIMLSKARQEHWDCKKGAKIPRQLHGIATIGECCLVVSDINHYTTQTNHLSTTNCEFVTFRCRKLRKINI